MWDRRFEFYLFYQKVDVYDGCLVFMNLGSVGNVSLEQHPQVMAGAFRPVGTIGIFRESIRSPAVFQARLRISSSFLASVIASLYASVIFMSINWL